MNSAFGSFARMAASARRETRAGPIVGGRERDGAGVARFSPHDRRVEIGRVSLAESSDLERAVQLAAAAQPGWDRLGGEGRAEALERAADLFEANRAGLMALLVREGGKTLGPALAEVREAVDYLRYYAMEARRLFSAPAALPGPTGEANSLRLAGRGVFACISPWNFPLAIFTGQIAAALAAGASLLKNPEKVFWGGYSGYFADPDGHAWELAHNPFFPLSDDGLVQLPD